MYHYNILAPLQNPIEISLCQWKDFIASIQRGTPHFPSKSCGNHETGNAAGVVSACLSAGEKCNMGLWAKLEQ